MCYCNDDYAGDRLERKNTSGSYQFLGDNLVSRSSKWQSTIALSTAEVEYNSLWMQHSDALDKKSARRFPDI